MANTKLTRDLRKHLENLIFDSITADPDRSAFDAATEAARKVVFDAIEKQFPAEDMKILEKYHCTTPSNWIPLQVIHTPENVQYGNWDLPSVTAQDQQALPRLPVSSRGNRIQITGEGAKIYREYIEASQAFHNATHEKRQPFRDLVAAAKYLEQVEEAWPAARKVRVHLRTLPIVQVAPLQERVKEVLAQ
jgi:hypothetical protein